MNQDPPRSSNSPAQITYDLAYLLAEVEELQRLAKGMGFGTLEYLLLIAAIEARHQAQLQRDE